ncbi:MAG TPA: transposase [Opitutaceae bacterium]|nr:transposase [Opitutaceae bacterium]
MRSPSVFPQPISLLKWDRSDPPIRDRLKPWHPKKVKINCHDDPNSPDSEEMRQARIKVSSEESDAVYHVMSRAVNGEWWFDPVAREVLRKQLWQVAEFAGIEVLTYAILSNHFHVLVRVPRKSPVADEELLRRYAVLYPQPTRFQAARLEVIKAQLASDGPEAVAWRKRQLLLMNDVSAFMKLVKQRFSIWFNRHHDRYGTLWAERFKSVLVEPTGRAIQSVAAYIDLNCVRAGLAQDPKDYRFCGYSEAVAGAEHARRGLQFVLGEKAWPETQAAYRQILFGAGASPRKDQASIPIERLRQVERAGGKLPLTDVLRCRVRYFRDGAILGSRAFVETQLAHYRVRTGRRLRNRVRPLPDITDWGGMVALRGVRSPAFG